VELRAIQSRLCPRVVAKAASASRLVDGIFELVLAVEGGGPALEEADGHSPPTLPANRADLTNQHPTSCECFLPHSGTVPGCFTILQPLADGFRYRLRAELRAIKHQTMPPPGPVGLEGLIHATATWLRGQRPDRPPDYSGESGAVLAAASVQPFAPCPL